MTFAKSRHSSSARGRLAVSAAIAASASGTSASPEDEMSGMVVPLEKSAAPSTVAWRW